MDDSGVIGKSIVSDKPKKRFYQSCLFWFIVAILWMTIIDSIAVMLPAWQAERAKRAAEQSSP